MHVANLGAVSCQIRQFKSGSRWKLVARKIRVAVRQLKKSCPVEGHAKTYGETEESTATLYK